MNNAIIICTEKGYLEQMSILLIKSIRKFGGKYKNIPIYSYQPRKSFQISQDTVQFFEKNNVEYIDLDLNTKFKYYPLANKPIACSHAEQNINVESLIFLDSDVVIFNEPDEFFINNNSQVRLRAVDVKNIGIESFTDINSKYWKNIYKLLNIKEKMFIKTTVDDKSILSYWNSGHIVSHRSNNLFSNWYKNFQKVMDKRYKPQEGIFFVEQSVFAATVRALGLKISDFSKKYNFPIHMHNKIINKDNSILKTNEIVSYHYHNLFSNSKFLNPIKVFKLDSDKQIWFANELKKQNIYPIPYIKRIKNLLKDE
ncbi:MAG: hypothetical protein K8R54_11890 [Bacteroidales bacterium]|nr:hypothetical protein [Bacteroidales bacterium]